LCLLFVFSSSFRLDQNIFDAFPLAFERGSQSPLAPEEIVWFQPTSARGSLVLDFRSQAEFSRLFISSIVSRVSLELFYSSRTHPSPFQDPFFPDFRPAVRPCAAPLFQTLSFFRTRHFSFFSCSNVFFLVVQPNPCAS